MENASVPHVKTAWLLGRIAAKTSHKPRWRRSSEDSIQKIAAESFHSLSLSRANNKIPLRRLDFIPFKLAIFWEINSRVSRWLPPFQFFSARQRLDGIFAAYAILF